MDTTAQAANIRFKTALITQTVKAVFVPNLRKTYGNVYEAYEFQSQRLELQQIEALISCEIAQKNVAFLCNQTEILHVVQNIDILRKKS